MLPNKLTKIPSKTSSSLNELTRIKLQTVNEAQKNARTKNTPNV